MFPIIHNLPTVFVDWYLYYKEDLFRQEKLQQKNKKEIETA